MSMRSAVLAVALLAASSIVAAQAPVDRLVQAVARQKGMQNDMIDQTVVLVDGWLERNRKKA